MTREEQIMVIASQYAINETDGQNNGKAASKRGLLLSAFRDGAKWADQHPHWIPVEEAPFPPKKNKWDKKIEVLVYGLWMGRPTILFGTYHYDTNEWGANGLMSDITHWMEIVPPRKGDKK